MKCHVGSRKFELVVQREGIEFESSSVFLCTTCRFCLLLS